MDLGYLFRGGGGFLWKVTNISGRKILIRDLEHQFYGADMLEKNKIPISIREYKFDIDEVIE